MRRPGLRALSALAVVRGACATTAACALAAACATFGGSPPASDDAGADSAAAPEAAPVPEAAPPGDADASDASDAGPTSCAHSPRGTSTACTNCVVEPVHLIPARPDGGLDAGAGPFVFGVTADATHVYWLEQSGGPEPYDGNGATSALKRKKLGAVASAPADTLVQIAGRYDRLVVTDRDLWLGSGAPGEAIQRVNKACVAPCSLNDVVGRWVAKAMIPYGSGVAVATGSSIVLLDAARTLETSAPGASAVAWSGPGLQLAYASEGPGFEATVRFVDSNATATLLPTHPTRPLAAHGGSFLAGTCGRQLWALQRFSNVVDSGSTYGFALVHTGADAGPVGVDSPELAFALGADESHAYLARPNNQGVLRWSPADGVRAIAPGKSAWSLAVTDEYVYFDDHGTNRTTSSVGIYRAKKGR